MDVVSESGSYEINHRKVQEIVQQIVGDIQ
jgi:hypothetical protein